MIKKFDGSGRFCRMFGAKGSAPGELMSSFLFTIEGGYIHVYERNRGINILNTDGKYISKKLYLYDLPVQFKALSDDYLVTEMKTGRNDTDWRIYTTSLVNKDSLTEKKMSAIEFDVSYFPTFIPADASECDQKRNFYLVLDPERYSLLKMNPSGEVLYSIERNYQRKPFSENVAKRMANTFLKRGNKMPKYPPVIRKVLINSRNNVWVVSGEYGLDTGRDDTVANVDIYSDTGEWLYHFTTDKISRLSFIKNDRLYSFPDIVKINQQIAIKVYKIIYSK